MTLSFLIPVFLILFALIGVGMPIYIGILASAIYLQVFVNHMPLQNMFTGIFEAMNKNSLMALPYFIIAGNFIAKSSLGERLINVFMTLCKKIRGGLAVSCVLTNAVFGAISGSPPAATATFGKIIYKPLKESYNDKIALGVVTSAGALASIIPPSMVMIIYGICTDTSIGNLFKGGILPGLLIVAILCAYLVVVCKEKSGRKVEHVRGERRRAIVRSIPVMVLPVIILGGIYGGIFTPTEAGAISALYSFIISVFVLRDISFKELPALFKDSAKTMGQLFMLIAASTVFGQALNISQAPLALVKAFSGFNSIQFLLMLNVLLLIVGCFFDTGAAVLILAPLLLPTALALGINPVHLGLVFTVNLSIGMFTPPFGMNIFVAQSILGRPMAEISRAVVPFIVLYVIGLLIITYFPFFSLALL
jgi:C4-dicarboxylate transporter, DctM subunit